MRIVVFVTASAKPEAVKIAKRLLDEKLAACVNIVDKVESFFWWKGKIDNARECLLIIKSRKAKLNKIIKCVRSLHSYDVPEIIALPIEGGYPAYLEWIDGSVGK